MGEDTDIRSKRLAWIREGSNWLVGFAAGALVTSGTYFYDRFGASPEARFILILAWILLAVCILSGVLTYFSAWRDLRLPVAGASTSAEEPLGPWVAHCYTIMMWTFLLGYLALAIALILNVAGSGPPKQQAGVEVECLPSGDDLEIKVRISPAPSARPAP